MGTETDVKPGNEGGVTPPAAAAGKGTEGAKSPTVEELQKQLAESHEEKKKLQDESAKRRISEKAAKETAEKAKAALRQLTGEEGEPDPAALEKKRQTATMRNLHLKSAFVSQAAREMHDAEFAYDAVAKELSDVEVDVDTGKVDKAMLQSKIHDLKKSKPFLFATASSNGSNIVVPAPRGNPDNGQPNNAGAGGKYKEWRDLMDAGRRAEGNALYAKHTAEIKAGWPSDVKFQGQ